MKEVADRLKAKLEAGRRIASRKDTSVQRKLSTTIEKDAGKEEEEVVLTRTDRHGNVYPLKVSGDDPEPKRKRRKTKKVGSKFPMIGPFGGSYACLSLFNQLF